MSMTVQEIRSFVRGWLDVDAEDVPDTVIDTALREGYSRIIGSQKHWPFLHREWALNTITDTSDYLVSEKIETAAVKVAAIESIKGPRWTLRSVNRQDGDDVWRNTTTIPTGEPELWSLYGDTLRMYPMPNAVYSMVIIGFRKGTPPSASGDTPDCPEEFHEPLAFYCLSAAYAQQDDPEQAALMEQRAMASADLIAKRYLSISDPQPLVFGKGVPSRAIPGVLRYPFDGGYPS